MFIATQIATLSYTNIRNLFGLCNNAELFQAPTAVVLSLPIRVMQLAHPLTAHRAISRVLCLINLIPTYLKKALQFGRNM